MVSAIILAAGKSHRMGQSNKLLLSWHNKPLVVHTVDSVFDSSIDEKLAVLGYQATLVRETLKDYALKFINNPNYEQGMLSSIQAGIRETSKNTQGWLICLGDQPRIHGTMFDKLLEVFRNRWKPIKDLIVLPVCDGIRRNPVIFSQSFRERLLMHQGEGAKEIVNKYEKCIIEVPFESSSIFKDIDTFEEYELLKNESLMCPFN